MSYARQIRRIARAHAVRLGEAAAILAVEDFAQMGGTTEIEGYEVPGGEASSGDLLATIAPGQLGWDEAAINAGAAEIDRCPKGFEGDYYAAYETSARATVRRLAEVAA